MIRGGRSPWGRSLVPSVGWRSYSAAGIQSPAQLAAFHRRFDALGKESRQAMVLVQVASAVVIAGLLWFPAAPALTLGVTALLLVALIRKPRTTSGPTGRASRRRRRHVWQNHGPVASIRWVEPGPFGHLILVLGVDRVTPAQGPWVSHPKGRRWLVVVGRLVGYRRNPRGPAWASSRTSISHPVGPDFPLPEEACGRCGHSRYISAWLEAIVFTDLGVIHRSVPLWRAWLKERFSSPVRPPGSARRVRFASTATGGTSSLASA